MKAFYASLDLGCSSLVTQSLQHMAIGATATQKGGRVTYYLTESLETLVHQTFLRLKLKEMMPIDGLIFFRMQQFLYGGSFDYAFLGEILGQGIEVHFAREGFSLLNPADLDRAFPVIHTTELLQTSDIGAALQSLFGTDFRMALPRADHWDARPPR